jgi:hypothetical protein
VDVAKSEHEFTLILAGIDLSDEVLDRLYEAGCDDALLGVRDGVVFADFARQADSLLHAVLSAAGDVKRADVGATVVHVEPDEFVTMAEIARRLGVTREGVRKWVLGTRGPGRFPVPVGNLRRQSPIWRWTDVVRWCQAVLPEVRQGPKAGTANRPARPKASRPAGIASLESAADVAAVNAALDLVRYAGPDKAARLLRAVAARG